MDLTNTTMPTAKKKRVKEPWSFTYYPQDGAGYLRLQNCLPHKQKVLIAGHLVIDVDSNNEIIGVEILLPSTTKKTRI
jgi:uncharacterized protein YuzE